MRQRFGRMGAGARASSFDQAARAMRPMRWSAAKFRGADMLSIEQDEGGIGLNFEIGRGRGGAPRENLPQGGTDESIRGLARPRTGANESPGETAQSRRDQVEINTQTHLGTPPPVAPMSSHERPLQDLNNTNALRSFRLSSK